MDIRSIEKKLAQYKAQNLRVFATSSFQTHSVVLLHILKRVDSDIPVYFINTGFHFAETIQYKDMITERLGLNVHNLMPQVPKSMQINSSGDLMFTYDPDYCCYLNKVQPVEALLDRFDVWVNGIRADQNNHRSAFCLEEKTRCNTIRYHPLLQWSNEMIEAYIAEYSLPVHPLEKKGYKSIGCEPCTRPAIGHDLRDARWTGMNKTECGLHLVR